MTDADHHGPLRPPTSPAPQPPPPPGPGGYAYPGGFAYPGPYAAPRPVPPPVSEAVLAIPLGSRDLIRQSLDLLTRSDNGLRGASFYIGFLVLATFGPFVAILGLEFASGAMDAAPSREFPAWVAWMLLAMIPAILGYYAAQVEASALATAVIGGRVEGRPLALRESIAIARKRFWSVLGPRLLRDVIGGVIGIILGLVLLFTLGPFAGDAVGTALSLVVALVVAAPFVFAPSGVVLGDVGGWESIVRSARLVGLRKRLAVVITLFGVFSQFIVTFGLGIGIDIVARAIVGAGLDQSFPIVLVVPLAATFVFAIGTLTFLVEAIAAAPAVHAFAALTHYTQGLEVGRREPVRGRHLWDPWVTPGLAVGSLVGLLALVGAVVSLPT